MISPSSRIVRPNPPGHCRLSRPGRDGTAGRGGFTLLEMLAVLLLLSIMVAVSAPATGRFLDSLAFRKETQAIRAVFNQARLQAVTSGQKVTVTLEEDRPALRLSGRENMVKMIGDGEGKILLRPAEIIFLPEGRATPATVEYSRDERRWEINVDPLTGLTVENDGTTES